MATPILNYWRKPKPSRHEGVTPQEVLVHCVVAPILSLFFSCLGQTMEHLGTTRVAPVVVTDMAYLPWLIAIAILGRKWPSAKRRLRKGWFPSAGKMGAGCRGRQ